MVSAKSGLEDDLLRRVAFEEKFKELWSFLLRVDVIDFPTGSAIDATWQRQSQIVREGERSDVKWCEVTLIFMRFSCGFHVVDPNCFTEAAAAGHATGRATAAAGNAGHAAAGAAGDAAGNASSTHDAHSTTTDADGAELKVKDSTWLKEKNRVMESSIFNLKQWNTEAPDGIHAGSLNFGVRGPQKNFRKGKRKQTKNKKKTPNTETNLETSDFVPLTP